MQFVINGTCGFMSSLTVLSQTLSSVVRTSNQKNRTVTQVDAYSWMKTIKKSKMVIQKKWSLSLSRGGRLHEGLTAKTLVFLIGGRLWRVVANKRWSHMEVQLYAHLSSACVPFDLQI